MGGKEAVNPTQHAGGVGQFGKWGVAGAGVGGTELCLDHTDDENDCGSYHYSGSWRGKAYTYSYHYVQSCDADEGCVYGGYSYSYDDGPEYKFNGISDGYCNNGGK